MSHVLVIGYGNPLRGDDGLGWHAAACLLECTWAREIDVRAVHQLTLELAEPISQADLVIFIDAREGKTSGLIACTSVSSEPSSSEAFSHHVSASSLLDCAKLLYGKSPDAVVFSVTGQSFGYGETLSPPVRMALPALLGSIEAFILGGWEQKGQQDARVRDS